MWVTCRIRYMSMDSNVILVHLESSNPSPQPTSVRRIFIEMTKKWACNLIYHKRHWTWSSNFTNRIKNKQQKLSYIFAWIKSNEIRPMYMSYRPVIGKVDCIDPQKSALTRNWSIKTKLGIHESVDWDQNFGLP